jgi:hypothetical protein
MRPIRARRAIIHGERNTGGAPCVFLPLRRDFVAHVKRSWLFPFLFFLLAFACTPDIAQDDRPPPSILARFDPGGSPPVVPAPNDLAKDPTTGRLVVPSTGSTPAAQREFNDDYLGGLDGFPFESTAEVLFTGDLDPDTVNTETVLVLDLTANASPVEIAPRWDATKKSVTIAPPIGGWRRAHKYAAAMIGGKAKNGLRGAKGEDVIGSPAWVLVSGKIPLFECEKGAPDQCRPTVDIIPSDKFDPHEKFADQVAKAKRLEQLRKGYAPLIDAIANGKGVKKADIPILWTFTTLDASEVTFDPANRVIPFPNDVVRQGPDGKVSLPHPKTGAPLTPEACGRILTDPNEDRQVQLTCGLNTLDGFSTQVAPVSENSADLGALQQGNIDPASLDAKGIGLVVLKPGVPTQARTVPRISPCLNCLSSKPESGAATAPEQLQWRLEAPLDEKTTYLAYLTVDVKDTKGVPIVAPPPFAFLRSKAPLVDGDKATVSSLSLAQAKQLEPLRAAMEPALDALEAQGVPRKRLALAFIFTTQSEASVLEQLAGVPGKAPGLPGDSLFASDALSDTIKAQAAANVPPIPTDAIGKFIVGAFLTPVLVTGPGGTFDPTRPSIQRVDFTMSVPSSPAPPGGYPITIFGHGFTRSRNDLLGIANSLARAGQITIATDVVFHGDRTSCTGSALATKTSTDDAACANPTQARCDGALPQGLCVLRDNAARNACAPGPAGDGFCAGVGQGRCAPDLKCQGADLARDSTGRPLVSGHNMFSLTNFFATRDNFRQQVIDLAQLVRVIKGPGLRAQSSTAIDANRIGYVGQSLGGILGTLFNAVSPDTTNVVLNVPGGALPQIILNAPSFAEQKTVLLAVLAAQGLKPGMAAFDQFLGVVQWILDPADPANMGYRLTHGVDVGGALTPNANRKAFIQFIEGDLTVPNISNFALVRAAANRTFAPQAAPGFGCQAPLFCYGFFEAVDAFNSTTVPNGSRHGFLLAPTALTAKAQTQVATFLATGALPP